MSGLILNLEHHVFNINQLVLLEVLYGLIFGTTQLIFAQDY